MDGFLQAIPSGDSVSPSTSPHNETFTDLKVNVEHGPEESVSIIDGYLHPYPEYEEEVLLRHQGEKMWKDIESLNRKDCSAVKILLLNLQLKDDSTKELSELSSLDKVIFIFTLLQKVVMC